MKQSPIKLSRLDITGLVTAATPAVVLKEIADAHSINWDKTRINQSEYLVRMVETINRKKISQISTPFDIRDYEMIACFVNRHKRWRRASLEQALYHMLQFKDIDKVRNIELGFTYGIQTPEEPTRLNACVLYAISRANRIRTRFDSTIDEMASNIKMFLSLRNPQISRTVKHAIYDSLMYQYVNGYQLVNILSIIDPDRSTYIMDINSDLESATNDILNNINTFTEVHIDYEDLRTITHEIRQRNIRVKPRTHVEAVAMAAVYYKMDISQVRNPLGEYAELCRTPYFPYDRTMAQRLRLANVHPDHMDNPRLNLVFNPELPVNMYEGEDLRQMCINEGYNESEIRDEGPYTLLQTSYLLPTFLHGKQGEITNNENTMLDELIEYEYDNVVVYGIRGQNMRFYTYGELADTFKALKRFQRPDSRGELFESRVINKLYIMAQKEQRTGESSIVFRERQELTEEIERLRLYENARQGPANFFISKCENLSGIEREKVNNTLTELLHCAMYMRGWSGEGPYPLTAEDTNVSYEEQPAVDLRVTQSLSRLDTLIQELNIMDIGEDISGTELGLGDVFKSLPLILYNRDSGEFLQSTNRDEGITIYDRVIIVRGGEDGTVQSCIRMSSNRFAASAYYYMRLIGMPITFNIEELSHIF